MRCLEPRGSNETGHVSGPNDTRRCRLDTCLTFIRIDAARRTDMVEDETTSYRRGHENGYWWLHIPLS
jgi:hypothetical protein